MKKDLVDLAFANIIREEVNHIQTGIEEVDEHLKFLGNGSVITVLTEYMLNRDFFTLNLMVRLLLRGKKCLYFSFLHKTEDLVQNLLILHSGAIIERGCNTPNKITPENLKKLKTARDEMMNWKLHVVDEGINIIENFDKVIEINKPDYVFIDDILSFPLEKMGINYFQECLRKIVKYEKMDIEETNVITNAMNKLLKTSRFNNETVISKTEAKKLIEEDIESKLPIKIYDNTARLLQWEDFAADYISESLKGIAVKNDTVIFVNYQTPADNQKLNIHNIKSKTLKKVSDTVILVENEILSHSTDNEVKVYKSGINLKFYKGNEFLSGVGGTLLIEYNTGRIIEIFAGTNAGLDEGNLRL